MSEAPALNEGLVELIDELGTTSVSMQTYRHTGRSRDPLSGMGARLSGGRWNPPGIPTIYLAHPYGAAMAELRHLADVTGTTYASLVRAGRRVHTVEVTGLEVLDLRDAGRRAAVGLTEDDLLDDDWSTCAAVGHAAWFLHFGGVLAPSARYPTGLVLAAFEDRVVNELACTKTEALN